MGGGGGGVTNVDAGWMDIQTHVDLAFYIPPDTALYLYKVLLKYLKGFQSNILEQ